MQCIRKLIMGDLHQNVIALTIENLLNFHSILAKKYQQ